MLLHEEDDRAEAYPEVKAVGGTRKKREANVNNEYKRTTDGMFLKIDREILKKFASTAELSYKPQFIEA